MLCGYEIKMARARDTCTADVTRSIHALVRFCARDFENAHLDFNTRSVRTYFNVYARTRILYMRVCARARARV